jgi:hypothetical protein
MQPAVQSILRIAIDNVDPLKQEATTIHQPQAIDDNVHAGRDQSQGDPLHGICYCFRALNCDHIQPRTQQVISLQGVMCRNEFQRR